MNSFSASNRPTCDRCGSVAIQTGTADDPCPVCLLRSALCEENPEEAISLLHPEQRFGPYIIEQEIARGGMGVVYRARQTGLDRKVALKLLLSGMFASELAIRRFQVEAAAAASLQHPNIVAIHEYGEIEGHAYYTMDYVTGQNLAELAAGRPLSIRQATDFARTIAAAIHYAHQQGILHRDLKPSNILVDLSGQPRITDFGLAKRLDTDEGVTMSQQMLGSPLYMAPEQALGRAADVGAASDIYSIGALLYQLLTGRPPLMAETAHETLRLVVEVEPVSPRELNPAVPRDVETICLKCLQKSAARRYASGQALVDELDRFNRGEPIQARPVSQLEQAWRWARRHPARAALPLVTGVALVATSLIFYGSAKRIARARDQEHTARLSAETALYASGLQILSRVQASAVGDDPTDTLRLLENSRPAEGRRDYRGFEWRHFWGLAKSGAVATLRGHHSTVVQAVFSSDGNNVASQGLDGLLKIWSVNDGRELASESGVMALGGYTNPTEGIVFQKTDNSLWLRATSAAHSRRLGSAHGRLIQALPNGTQIVVLQSDGRLTVQSATSEERTNVAPTPLPEGMIAAVSVGSLRGAVASPGLDGLHITDLRDERLLASLPERRPIISIAFTPDGERLAAASFDGIVNIWNVTSSTLEKSFQAFLDPIWGMAFSPDGKIFAVAGNNRSVRLWDVGSWEEKQTLRGHSTTVHCLAFSPDGRQLVSGAEDELTLVWPTTFRARPLEMPRLLRGPNWSDATPNLAFSPDSRYFAGTAADGTAKVWQTDTLETVASFPIEARTLSFSPDGSRLIAEDFHGVVKSWILADKSEPALVQPGIRFEHWAVADLSNAERVSLIAQQPSFRALTGTCNIGSARDALTKGAIMHGPTLVASADGQLIYIGMPSGVVETWNVPARKRISAFKAHKLPISSIAVSIDGQYLATGSLDNTTQLWQTGTNEHIATYHGHNRPVWALAFSPDSRTLAAGSCDKEIILCSIPLRLHVASLQTYSGVPHGFEQEVRYLRFSPDGQVLAAVLGDGTVRFFRAPPFSETDAPAARLALATSAKP